MGVIWVIVLMFKLANKAKMVYNVYVNQTQTGTKMSSTSIVLLERTDEDIAELTDVEEAHLNELLAL